MKKRRKTAHRAIVTERAGKDGRIPIRQPRYFSACYTKAEIRADNRVAHASVVRAPIDLE